MDCWFDGAIDLHKGHIVKITRGIVYENQGGLRVSTMENLTTGANIQSSIEGVMMAKPPVSLDVPIIGRIKSSAVRGNNTTEFVIEEGMIEDHVFVRAGDVKKGQEALENIFKNQVQEYVKICDPYISGETIILLSNVPGGIDILVLTENIKDLPLVKQEISKQKNKIVIRKGGGLHDRFILTKGEGWNVGHSLKDFGTKVSHLSKMVSSVDAESAFDDNWVLSDDV